MTHGLRNGILFLVTLVIGHPAVQAGPPEPADSPTASLRSPAVQSVQTLGLSEKHDAAEYNWKPTQGSYFGLAGHQQITNVGCSSCGRGRRAAGRTFYGNYSSYGYTDYGYSGGWGGYGAQSGYGGYGYGGGGMHAAQPYYSYRAPWYSPGPTTYPLDVNTPW